MGLLEDIMLALERIPVWKRVKALPDEVEALKARINSIEQRMAGGSGHLCPKCSSPQFKLESSNPNRQFGRVGILDDSFKCAECGHSETRQRPTRPLGGRGSA